MADDAKARLRRQLGNRTQGLNVPVDAADLTAVLRELGALRVRISQAEKAIRTTAEDWSKKGMPLGRIFANYAAEMWMAECGELRQLLGFNHDAMASAMQRGEWRNQVMHQLRHAREGLQVIADGDGDAQVIAQQMLKDLRNA